MKKLFFTFSFLLFLTFFVSCVTTFVKCTGTNFDSFSKFYLLPISQEYSWPIPDYYNISSHFGNRISPTTGLPSKHSGIDIPAPVRY